MNNTATNNVASASTPSYTVLKNATGDRFIKLANGNVIPCDIAGLAAGKDAWMRNIQLKCRDCGQKHPLFTMFGNGQYCEECSCADIND